MWDWEKDSRGFPSRWFRTMGSVFVVMLCLSTPVLAQQMLPAGLSSADPETRRKAVTEVCQQKMMMAERKIAAMAKTDPNPGVREAACLGLATMGAYSEIDTLRSIFASDVNPLVRGAAKRALTALGGDPAVHSTTVKEPVPPEKMDGEDYKKPELTSNAKPVNTRSFAVGFGSMGGYGLASMNLRGRIQTGAAGLPFVGIELGGGWTPPQMLPFIAGPIAGENDASLAFDPNLQWKILSWAGAVQLYFHRMHYVPIRVGWDVGRGAYTMLGYGFEHLNPEGFFSWGIELGMLYQPVIGDHINDLVVNAVPDDLWKVIPFIRFTLHFYLA